VDGRRGSLVPERPCFLVKIREITSLIIPPCFSPWSPHVSGSRHSFGVRKFYSVPSWRQGESGLVLFGKLVPSTLLCEGFLLICGLLKELPIPDLRFLVDAMVIDHLERIFIVACGLKAFVVSHSCFRLFGGHSNLMNCPLLFDLCRLEYFSECLRGYRSAALRVHLPVKALFSE